MLTISQRIRCVVPVILLLCASHCWAQSGAPKPSGTPSGEITGRVVNSAGEPLAGASITAGPIRSGVRGKTGTADSHGDFKIDGLEPGLYNMFVTMPGYVLLSKTPTGDSTGYYRQGDSVTFTLTKGGVITGTVTGPNGPLVGVGTFATRVRDAADRKIFTAIPSGFERRTDDRGIFRFYGLPPGAYILTAMRPRVGTVAPSAYDLDMPTYYPSSTRDTAAQIVVREGDEITADIQYRAEPGHAVSGKLSGVVTPDRPYFSNASISLTDVRDRTQIANTGISFTDAPGSFALYGIPDGEYELSALQYLSAGDQLRSPPRRVTVHGADITGISLTLAPLASIEGRFFFEPDPKAGCAKRRETATQETLVYARRYEPEKKPGADPKVAEPEVPLSVANFASQAVGDAKGSFNLRNLLPGSYRIDPRPPASGWYIRTITIGATQAAARTAGVATARDGVAVRTGERVSGLTVTMTEGASRLSGRVTGVDETMTPRLRVYLIPVEPEAAENVLRFYQSSIEVDGRFIVDNVAPGKYWIVARPTPENESGTAISIRQDATLRANVLRDAGTLKRAVTLTPCQQVADFELPYVASTSAQ
jgi:Carboxypeptidase regulatory-like domain